MTGDHRNPVPDLPPAADEPSLEIELRRQLQQLGFTRPPFRDEETAPSVDCDLLLSLVRRDLPDVTAQLVYRLVYSFRSWNDAYRQVIVEEFQRHAQPPAPTADSAPR